MALDAYSYVGNADTNYIEELYKTYQENPDSVDDSWKNFFEGFDFSIQKYGKPNGESSIGKEAGDFSFKELNVYKLIHAYRSRAHLKADTNPVRTRKDRKPRLDISDFNLTEEDLQKQFKIGGEIGLENASLQEIIEALRYIYEGTIGFEYTYIREPQILDWLKEKIEKGSLEFNPPIEMKKRILYKLNEAVTFENFLHTKYIGQKRFSLEGGENLITALDTFINTGSELGAEELIIGMAHRGRLNVLANIMGKTYEQIFTEFEGAVMPDQTMGNGDVKYHMGYSSKITLENGKEIYLKLCPNPSHLESVDPLVIGYARAQIDDEYMGDNKKAVPVLIHGDAALAGQGVIYEIAQMSKLKAYSTGGTIHFIINNQVGFTTDFEDARSSIYCTDIAKIIDAPVVHINGDDPEAMVFVSRMAIEYRQNFGLDIFIDMVCYRRHGHNEADEPKFTQPKLYNIIAKHPNPREVYHKTLIKRDNISKELAKDMDKEFRSMLQDRLNQVKQQPLPYQPQKLEEEWHQMRMAKPDDFDESPDTAISEETINRVGEALTTIPQGFKPLKQIDKLLKERKTNFFERKTLSWADAELLAYGSLLLEKKIVRLSGQDTIRGTFSHRHSILFDAETNEAYCNLNHITDEQEKFKVYNSLLSEFGALGFEYGYAMATPNALVIWEAQFGDFANGAQVMIDQFITSAETKWQRMNGLVLLLPHGYEGQGPEHSNARPERFLQLSAEYNQIVANITTPANFFHLLRRQVVWPFRKPCVVMSPKSLLRHSRVISPIQDFTHNKFREVIDDENVQPEKVNKLLLCTGKIYFELLEKQQKDERDDVAIVRIEQLAPFPENQVDQIIAKYDKAKKIWVQEEPENMGYWAYILRVYRKETFDIVSRKASASPATGYGKVHFQEQKTLIENAFSI